MYWFQALSTNNRFYLQMMVPLQLDALPEVTEDGQFGVNFGRDDPYSEQSRPLRKQFLQRVDNFLRSHEDEFVPMLSELDALVLGLEYHEPPLQRRP